MISKEGSNIIIYSIIPKISHFGYIIKIFSFFQNLLFYSGPKRKTDFIVMIIKSNSNSLKPGAFLLWLTQTGV